MGTSKPLTLDQNMFTAGLLSEPLPSKSPSKPSLSQLAEKLATFNSSMAGNHFRLPAIVPQHSSKAVLTDKVLLQEDLVTTKAHPGFNNHQKYRMTIYKTNSIWATFALKSKIWFQVMSILKTHKLQKWSKTGTQQDCWVSQAECWQLSPKGFWL